MVLCSGEDDKNSNSTGSLQPETLVSIVVNREMSPVEGQN